MHLRIKQLFSYFGINNIVFINLIGQFTVFITGPLSLIFITKFVSVEMQGYYYTFFSILSVQTFLELGFSQCIVNFASHEFSFLKISSKGHLSGEEFHISRLLSLLKLSLRWYGIISLLIVTIVSIVGYIFFINQQQYGINWIFPWFLLCLGSSLNILLLPITSILEGCNQYLFLGKFRLFLRPISVLSIWVSLYYGFGLYALAISSFASFFYTIIIYLLKWFDLFKQSFTTKIEYIISWKKEILPLQWKIALSWICGYLIFSLFNPVLFAFQGAIIAGKMGITWSLISIINSFANTINGTKVAEYGMLISNKEYKKLDKLWKKSTWQTILLASIGSIIFLLVIFILKSYFTIGYRFLNIPEIILLLISVIVNQVIFSQNIYLRAHQKEPFLGLFLINALLASFAIVFTAKYLNVFYVCLSYTILLSLTSIYSTKVFINFKEKIQNPLS